MSNVRYNKVVFDINKDYLNEEYMLFSITTKKDNVFTVISKNDDFVNISQNRPGTQAAARTSAPRVTTDSKT